METDGTYSDELLRRIDEHNRRELEKRPKNVREMLERVEYFAFAGDLSTSRKWLIEAQDKAASADERVLVLTMMARYGSDHATASRCYEEAARLTGPGNPSRFSHLCYKAGTEAFFSKDYPRARQLLQQALALDVFAKESESDYLIALEVLGNVCFALSDYEGATSALAQEMERYREAGNLHHYYSASCKAATILKFQQRYDEAIILLEEALSYFDAQGLDLDYISAKTEYAACCRYAGKELPDLDDFHEKNRRMARKILQEEISSLAQTRKYLGEDQYARSLGIICGSYALLGETDSAWKYARLYVDALKEAVAARFKFAGSSEKEAYWESHKDHIRQIQSMYDKNGPTSGAPSAILYDLALLQKGILLGSSVEIRDAVYGSGDKGLEALFEKVCQLEKSDGQAPEESLERERLTLELTERCAAFKEFTAYLDYGWKDVRGQLEKGDMAIEFIICSDAAIGLDNVLFAVILHPEAGSPLAVPLCNAHLQESTPEWSEEDAPPALADSIWNPIVPYCQKDVTRLYFSPDHILSHVNIEYDDKVDGGMLADRFEVHRLSSTKELCRRRPQRRLTSAALFGGADYSGRQFARLEEGLDEVIEIRNTMLEHGFDRVDLYVRGNVSKASFCALSGKAPSIIHFAGHGYFDRQAEDGMKGSQLIVSGDESITAEEIAGLNLRGCELVILNACHTGFGKAMDDGIYGLQRAFKQAGVRSVLMTTGSVGDVESSVLLQTFFRHLLAGSGIRDAFETARRKVRAGDDAGWGTTTGKYILLDG